MNEQQIFVKVLAHSDPADRLACLDEACQGDLALKQRVEVLLQAHDRAGQFLESPAAGPDATSPFPPLSERPGTVIGPYKLIEEIGEGGFGVVFMAQQNEPVRRMVALKVVKPGMDSRQIVARFEAERQALALMDHPNIAKVLDAGTTETGRPYFVMELVKGVPITRYCDQQHLTPRERLGLFVPVCQAIQHAHQKGIIHRDLKPSNVLIALYDDKPVPKVIDFGVAKATGQQLTQHTLHTGFGAVVGTVEYMSPEQASFNQLDVDTRSDIYSLGVILYELLTGSPPFSRKDLEREGMLEMLRVIREQEPAKPSTKLSTAEGLPSLAAKRNTEPAKLTRTVRGELDWIVMKALEKDRARRYETANGLARDVERYLADEPVQACPPSAAYRFRKFARRYKATLAITSVAALALIVVAVASIIAAGRFRGLAQRNAELAVAKDGALQKSIAAEAAAERARQQEKGLREEAERQTQIAQEQSARAEANFVLARSAVDEFLNQVTEDELLTVPGMQRLRQDLLNSAMEFYDKFTQDEKNADELQAELATAHYRISLIRGELGQTAESKASLNKSIELFERLRSGGNDSREVRLGLASSFCRAYRHDDAVALCQSILREDPKHTETRSLLAETYNALAIKDSSNDLAGALKHHQQALALRESLVQDFPGKPEYLAALGSTVNNLGVLLSRQGKEADALAMYQRSVGYAAEAHEKAPHNIQWGRWLCVGVRNVALLQKKSGSGADETLQSFERLVALRRKLAFENPAVPSLKAELYKAWIELGAYQRSIPKNADANRSFRAAEDVVVNIPRNSPDEWYNLACVYAGLATPIDDEVEPAAATAAEEHQHYANLAMEALRRAVEMGYSNVKWLQADEDLAHLRTRGDFKELVARLEQQAKAEQLVASKPATTEGTLVDRRHAIDSLRPLIGSETASVRHQKTLAAALHSVGLIETGLEHFPAAEKALEEAFSMRESIQANEPNSPSLAADLGASHIALGDVYWKTDRIAAARQRWEKGLELLATAVSLAPDNESLKKQVAEQERTVFERYGELGLWQRAVEFSKRNVAQKRTSNSMMDSHFAILLLATGDVDGHREYGRLLAESFSNSDPSHALWAVAMNPKPALPRDELLKTADKVATFGDALFFKTVAASAYFRAGEYQRARDVLQPLSRFEGNNRYGAYLLAMIHHKLDRGDDARRLFENAERSYREEILRCVTDRRRLGIYAKPAGWWELAHAQVLRREAWNSIQGQDPPACPWQHLIQARGYRLIGEAAKSDAELAAAAAAAPSDPKVWMNRAKLFAEWNDQQHVESDWQKAVELAGTDPMPWIHRGRWYAERGEQQKAGADFAKAASQTPNELNRFLEAGWWVIGPYPADVSEFCPPELDPDPSKPVFVVDSKSGLSEQPLAWRSVPLRAGGGVHLADVPQLAASGSYYALALVYAPAECTTLARVEYENALRLWCNGELVYDLSAEAKKRHHGAPRVPLALQQGRNVLLAKVPVGNSGTASDFRVQLGDAPLNRLLTFAEIGLWAEALELDHGATHQELQSSSFTWGRMALMHLLAGDEPAYTAACREIYGKHGQSTAPGALHDVLTVLLLGQNPVWDEHSAKLASSAIDLFNLSDSPSFVPNVRRRAYVAALACYRKGEYTESKRILETLGGHGFGQIALPLAAMLAHRTGDAQRAEQCLAESASFLASEDFPRWFWIYQLKFQLTLREAFGVVKGSPAGADELLLAARARALKAWEGRDPASAAFDHCVMMDESFEPSIYKGAYLARGRHLARLGRFDSAQADFDKAVSLKPDDIDVRRARAVLYSQRGDAEQSQRDFETAMNLAMAAPKPDRFWLVSRVESQLGRHDAVLKNWQDRSDQAWLWRCAAQRQIQLGNWQRAAELLSRHEHWSHDAMLAPLCCLLGDADGYQKACQHQLERLPTEWEPSDREYHRLHMLALRPVTGDEVDELRRLLEARMNEFSAERWHRLIVGTALYRTGRYDEAQQVLSQGLQPQLLWQRDAPIWPVLAMTQWQRGHHDEARKWLAKSAWWIDFARGARDVPQAAGGRTIEYADWLQAHLFHAEAKALIEGNAEPRADKLPGPAKPR